MTGLVDRLQSLLLPGLLNDAELWRDQVADLSEIATCVVPDLTRGDSLEELVRDVLARAAPHFAWPGSPWAAS